MPPVQKTRHRIDPDAIPSPVSASCLSAVLCCYTVSQFLCSLLSKGCQWLSRWIFYALFLLWSLDDSAVQHTNFLVEMDTHV